MLEVVRRLGSIQFDPIPVAGRSHDLVLHARVAGYEPAWCDLLYERREIFEAYNKGLSFVPTSEFPWFRAPWGRSRSRSSTRTPRWPRACSSGSARTGRSRRSTSSARAGRRPTGSELRTNTVRAVLEAYAVTGVLGLARREGNRRYYDLLERLLPGRCPRARAPVPRAAPAQAAVAVPGTRPARRQRRAETSSAASAPRSPTPGSLVTPDGTRCARSSSRRGSSSRSRSRA